MKLLVQQTIELSGKVTPPSSKSQCIRGLILASIAAGESYLTNILHSDDSHDAISVCQKLGADMTVTHQSATIKSLGLPLQLRTDAIYTGNSGITTRFLLPLLGLRQNNHIPIRVDCGEQMRARPIASLVQALNQLGMSVTYLEHENQLPLRVTGELRGGKAEISGVTSQYLSALLMALPCAKDNSEIIVRQLNERPYVEMTLAWLNEQGIDYRHERAENVDTFMLRGGQTYHAFNKQIPGDFSSASYFIAASALIGSEVTIEGLDMNDTQGDKALISLLQKMGADIHIHSTHITIRGGKPLTGITIDANDIPDLLPTLAVVATAASGETRIINVPQARLKETDRIHSMTRGLRQLGASITELEDGMIIQSSTLQGATVDGYGDHRTVMALSLAGMFASGDTYVTDAEAINKTFPNYVTLMQSLGGKIEEVHANGS